MTNEKRVIRVGDYLEGFTKYATRIVDISNEKVWYEQQYGGLGSISKDKLELATESYVTEKEWNEKYNHNYWKSI